ncbi:potassium/sodium hyperpolarization-activated cyclic nucleotide-gated channel 2-like [Pan troglodytes]|uniref:potassium/sodium hyperpolarization-activated cyclic nucleotide-gated channel 2-like n=1 Tax=Pan troglodytes TaxID=9598 RepID=UPI003013F0D6
MEMNDSLPDANLHQTDTGVTTQPILPSTARDVSGTGTRPPDPPFTHLPSPHSPFSPHPPSPPPTPGPAAAKSEEPLECLPLLEALGRRARACSCGGEASGLEKRLRSRGASDGECGGPPGTLEHPPAPKPSPP